MDDVSVANFLAGVAERIEFVTKTKEKVGVLFLLFVNCLALLRLQGNALTSLVGHFLIAGHSAPGFSVELYMPANVCSRKAQAFC